MLKDISTFQIILLVIFGVAIVLSVLAFSGFLPGLSSQENLAGGDVVIWGTFSPAVLPPAFSVITEKYSHNIKLIYKQKDVENFDQDLVEALAGGTGPDLIIIPDTLIARHKNKIAEQPFAVAPLRTYLDTFVDGATIFLTKTGILAYPLVADPMVLYYNKDALARAGYADTPRYWSQLIDGSMGASPLSRLTSIDERGNVLESAIGLGDYGNVDHAKDIVALFFLQIGNPIVTHTSEGKTLVTLSTNDGRIQSAAAINFFTQFSNPTKTTYTWNSSLPNSRTLFGTGKLALYLGFASERSSIVKQNAHLNFDIAEVPQRDASKKITTGRMYAIALMKQSKNPKAALVVEQAFADKDVVLAFAGKLGLPTLRRDLLSQVPSDPYLAIFNRAAIVTRVWPDPNPEATEGIFGTMIQSTLTGQVSALQAVDRASKELTSLISAQ